MFALLSDTQGFDVAAQARERPQYDALRVQDLDQAVPAKVGAFLGKPLPLGQPALSTRSRQLVASPARSRSMTRTVVA